MCYDEMRATEATSRGVKMKSRDYYITFLFNKKKSARNT